MIKNDREKLKISDAIDDVWKDFLKGEDAVATSDFFIEDGNFRLSLRADRYHMSVFELNEPIFSRKKKLIELEITRFGRVVAAFRRFLIASSHDEEKDLELLRRTVIYALSDAAMFREHFSRGQPNSQNLIQISSRVWEKKALRARRSSYKKMD